jgi:hypothetical protein
MIVVGFIVLAAVSLAFGAVGVGVGIGVLTGMAALVYLRRRRSLSQLGGIPGVK